jgi:hypothetical protein
MFGLFNRRLAAILGGASLVVALLPSGVLAANVAVAPTITSASSTTFTVGAAGTFSVTTTGTPTPSISETGALPAGVTFTDHHTGTATVAGTPAASTSGTYPIRITAANGTSPNAVQTFTLTVNRATNHLYFATQPGGGAAGAAWTQQPVVEVVSAANQLVSTDNSTMVALSIRTNPAAGMLSCTSGTGRRVVKGVATFFGCRITRGAANPYTLTATSSADYAAATSNPFYVGGGARTPVSLADAIAPGVNRGTSGFGMRSLAVARDSYVTVLVQTSPNLAGSLVQIWVASKTSGWHDLTLRRVAADGTVHYFARVNGWTAYWVKFPGTSTYAAAASHGRIATNPS